MKRALVALLAALAVLCGAAPAGALPAAPAVSATATSANASQTGVASSRTTQTDPQEGATLSVESLTPGVLRPDQPLTATVRVTAGTDAVPEGSQLEFRLQRSTLPTRYAVKAWAEAPRGRAIGTMLVAAPVGAELAPGTSRVISLNVPADRVGLGTGAETFGPRGIAVVLRTPDGTRAYVARTHLVWYPPGVQATPLRATVVVPMTVGQPDPRTGLPPASALAAQTDSTGRLTSMLAGAGAGVTLALDPSLLAAQPNTTASVTAWRRQLLTHLAGREVLLLPSANADLVSLVHADATELITSARRLGADHARDLTRTAKATDTVALPVNGQLDPESVSALSRLGYSAAIVSGGSVAPRQEQVTTSTGLADLTNGQDKLTGLVSDDELSAVLAESGRTDSRGPALTQQQLLADAAAVVRESPGQQRHVLLLAPSDWDPNAGGRAAVASLMSAPWVTPSSVEALRAEPVPALARRGPAIDDDVLGGELSKAGIDDVLAGLDMAARDAEVAEDPQRVLSALRQPAVGMVSASWRDRADWRAGLSTYRSVTSVVRDSVRVIPGSTVNQVSQEVRLPVTVGNNLDQRVRVRVVARPTTSRLQVTEPSLEVELAGNSRTVAYLPVRGVGSGEAAIEVALQTVDGHTLGPPSTVNVLVRADWENRVTFTLAALGGVVLVAGITRTLRRGRTRAQAIAEDARKVP